MSTPPPRISLSELWGHARIRDLLSINVKCKILKLRTEKSHSVFRHSPDPPPPPPPKKKKKKKKKKKQNKKTNKQTNKQTKKTPESAYGRLLTFCALIPYMDLLIK